VSAVPVRTFTAAAALAAAVAVSAVAVRRYREVHRVLARERATHRLTEGCLHRDLAAFQTRIGEAMARHEAGWAAWLEADLVLDEALAMHRVDPHDPFDDPLDPFTEGGPTI
jgi:hypothetical protein